MKLFKSKESNQQHKQIVLFVYIENAGRSQMAEGFFKRHALDGYDAISAGTRPVSIVNPIATEVMKEVGIDISTQIGGIVGLDIFFLAFISGASCAKGITRNRSHRYSEILEAYPLLES